MGHSSGLGFVISGLAYSGEADPGAIALPATSMGSPKACRANVCKLEPQLRFIFLWGVGVGTTSEVWGLGNQGFGLQLGIRA